MIIKVDDCWFVGGGDGWWEHRVGRTICGSGVEWQDIDGGVVLSRNIASGVEWYGRSGGGIGGGANSGWCRVGRQDEVSGGIGSGGIGVIVIGHDDGRGSSDGGDGASGGGDGGVKRQGRRIMIGGGVEFGGVSGGGGGGCGAGDGGRVKWYARGIVIDGGVEFGGVSGVGVGCGGGSCAGSGAGGGGGGGGSGSGSGSF